MITQILGPYHGGLGDSLAFSTLPEQFFRQKGQLTKISSAVPFRNKEIYELVWGCNPFVFGKSNLPRTAGDLEVFSDTPIKSTNLIYNNEYLHDLVPKNTIPKIYYKSKKIIGLEKIVLVDISSITLNFKNDENSWPPGYSLTRVISLFDQIKHSNTDLSFVAVKFLKRPGKINTPFVPDVESKVYIKNIFHYCDLMNSVYGIVTLYSGQMVLASAIKSQNPNLKIWCITPPKTYEIHNLTPGFIFENVEYLT